MGGVRSFAVDIVTLLMALLRPGPKATITGFACVPVTSAALNRVTWSARAVLSVFIVLFL